MFRKLTETLKSLSVSSPPSIPPSITDPLAAQTEWTPLRRGGANFKTHVLFSVNDDRMQFRASRGAVAFFGIFLLAGLGALVAAGFTLTKPGTELWSVKTILLPLVGLVFATIGGALLHFGIQPVVFDRRLGYFWKGKVQPNEVFDLKEISVCTAWKDIHALQLLSELCQGNKSSYYSYELNLVLEDGSRVQVVDHGNLKQLRLDARTLAAFLDKPLWDAA